MIGAERASGGILPAPQEGPGFPGEDTAERESQEEGTPTDRSRYSWDILQHFPEETREAAGKEDERNRYTH